MVIFIGLGEVGKTLYEILKASNTYMVYEYDVRSEISPNKLEELPRNAQYLTHYLSGVKGIVPPYVTLV